MGWTKFVRSSSPTLAEQARGVPQDSPLSPTLFNIFMDVLSEKIEPNDSYHACSAVILFADHVQPREKYRFSLQRDLKNADTWSRHSDMTWNVRKSPTIQTKEENAAFNMGREPVKVGASETYLGTTITTDGLTDALLKDRVKISRARLEMLKRIGLNAKKFGPKISCSMYLIFVRLMFEYYSDLVRIEKSSMQGVLALEKAFFNAVTGIYKASLPWFRKLFKLKWFLARRITLRDKMKVRIAECTRIDANVMAAALCKADNTAPSWYKDTVWNEADQHKVRKLPIPDLGLHLPFSLSKHRHRILSVKWFLLRFPASPEKVREVIGAPGDIAISQLSTILSAHKWSNQYERTKWVLSIPCLSIYQPRHCT